MKRAVTRTEMKLLEISNQGGHDNALTHHDFSVNIKIPLKNNNAMRINEHKGKLLNDL